MYKLLLIPFLFVGCIDKPKWKIDQENAFAKADSIIMATEGKYSVQYYTLNNTIVFNSTNTCVTFKDLLHNTTTMTCGTFTIQGK